MDSDWVIESAPKKPTSEWVIESTPGPVDKLLDTGYKVGSAVGRVGRVTMETGLNLFSGLYAWPASKVTGITTLLLTGDHGAAKAVEEGVANELTVKPQTEEAQYITNQIGRLIDIPMSLLGEVGRTANQMLYDTPLAPKAITRDEAAYIAEPAFQIGAMPGLLKIAKNGVKSMGNYAADVPQFLKEITGRGKDIEAAREAKALEESQARQLPDVPKDEAPMAPPAPVEVGGQSVPGENLIGSERGSFSVIQKEKPPLHEFPEEIEARWKAATTPEPPSWAAQAKDRIDSFYNKLTRVYEDLPNTAEFAPLKFELLNLQKYKGIASDKATRGLEEIVRGFDRPLLDLFERKVVVDDLMYSAERGMSLPYGFTPESLAAEKIIIDDVVSKNAVVDQAIAKRKARWEEIKSAYIDAMDRIGLDIEDRFKNPDYYHHQVLEYAQANNINLRGAGKLKTPANRGFLKRREGSELDINRDYLQVEHDVQAQMIHDIKTAEVIAMIDDRYNIADRIRKEAKASGIEDWRESIPEGYGIWQPREGNVFYMTQAVPAKIATELMSGALEEFGITSDMLKKTLALGGPRREFVLPNEVINTLDGLVKNAPGNVVADASKWLMKQWKEKIALINPHGFFKYNARNLSGDAEAVFVGNPSAFMKSKEAFGEIYNVFFGDGKMGPELSRFFDMGGFEGTMQAIEMKSFGDIKAFEHLYQNHKGVLDIPKIAWEKYWKTARLTTDLRESILRFAAYKEYLEQMKESPNGLPKNYGASIPEEIQALGDIERRAFWLQDDLLGAYDKVSVVGQHLRDHIWPFWSWKEVNAKRYIQLWKNAWNDGELAVALGKSFGVRAPFLAYNVGKFALKASAALAILEVYNQTFFPQEEDELPENVKKSAHIVFGRDSEGKIVYFDRLGILQDFLGNFGLDHSGYLAKKVFNGRMTVTEAAKEMAKGPLNVVAQGITPIWKTPAELAAGRKLFPDVTKPGTIRDKKLYIAEQLKLGEEYKALFGMPTEGYAASLKKMFLYFQDPGQAAYMDIMDEKRRYAERTGKEEEGFFLTPKGNALFNYKLALRYKDQKAAEHYLDEYIEKGGTGQGFMRSMQAMNPLYGMAPIDRIQFMAQLDDEGMKKLDRAIEYYFNTLSQ